jgi:hypothetical protein
VAADILITPDEDVRASGVPIEYDIERGGEAAVTTINQTMSITQVTMAMYEHQESEHNLIDLGTIYMTLNCYI